MPSSGSLHLVLIRHFAWLPWRDHVAALQRKLHQFSQAGCKVVVLSFGSSQVEFTRCEKGSIFVGSRGATPSHSKSDLFSRCLIFKCPHWRPLVFACLLKAYYKIWNFVLFTFYYSWITILLIPSAGSRSLDWGHFLATSCELEVYLDPERRVYSLLGLDYYLTVIFCRELKLGLRPPAVSWRSPWTLRGGSTPC